LCPFNVDSVIIFFLIFSAVIYLNDDFEGGDFFFAHRNRSAEVKYIMFGPFDL